MFHVHNKSTEQALQKNIHNSPPSFGKQIGRGHRPILRASGTWTRTKGLDSTLLPKKKTDLTSKNGDLTSKNTKNGDLTSKNGDLTWFNYKNWWSCGDMMG